MTAWKQVPIHECGEPLVPVGPFSASPNILTSGMYAGERADSPYAPGGLPGALLTPFVRRGVASRLQLVAELLPDDHYLLIWDSYRSIETQRALYEYFDTKLRAEHSNWTDEQITTEAQRFVSLPSSDPTKPSPHNTGGAVDLTIARLQGAPAVAMRRALAELARARVLRDERLVYEFTMLAMDLTRTEARPVPMGSVFDEVSEATLADHFERNAPRTAGEREAASNRELLRVAMQSAGFHRYVDEWWHFSHGDQMWAHARGGSARYGPAILSPANEHFERHIRRGHQLRNRLWHDGIELGAVYDFMGKDSPVAFARSIAHKFSDPRVSTHPVAHVL